MMLSFEEYVSMRVSTTIGEIARTFSKSHLEVYYAVVTVALEFVYNTASGKTPQTVDISGMKNWVSHEKSFSSKSQNSHELRLEGSMLAKRESGLMNRVEVSLTSSD